MSIIFYGLIGIILILFVWAVYFLMKKKRARKKEEENFKVPEGEYKVIEKEQNKIEVDVKPYETFKIHDLANMFPFNITPALIESKIVYEVAARQKISNRLTKEWAFLIIALLIGGVLAAYIAWKFFKGDATEVIVRLGPGLERITETATSNLTG